MRHRPVVRLAVPFASMLALAACSQSAETPSPVLTTRDALRDQMRQLWTTEATWTRMLIVSSAAGLDDQAAATARLVRNATDVGDAIEPFYGSEAGDHLTALLTEHVAGTTEIIEATLAADNARLQVATDAWNANADETARFLADLDPLLDYYRLYRLMTERLDEMRAETAARVGGHYDEDIAAQDRLVAGERTIGDTLTDAIAEQFPELVASRTFTSATQQSLHLSMRMDWDDQASWMRFFIVDSIAALPSAPDTTARLFRSADAIGGSMAQLYGTAAADQLTALLHAQIEATSALVAALTDGDAMQVQMATAAYDASASDLARFYDGLGPDWSRPGMEALFDEYLDRTHDEIVARVNGDWERDVMAYDMVLAQALRISDALAVMIARDVATAVPQVTD
jgi:hypothetical protein